MRARFSSGYIGELKVVLILVQLTKTTLLRKLSIDDRKFHSVTCSRKKNCCNKLVVFVLFLNSAGRFGINGFAVLHIQLVLVFAALCRLVLDTRGL